MSYSTKAITIAGVPLHSPQECPKWTRCSAPICPLDPLASERKMLPGEAVCPYISEAVKDESSFTFEAAGLSWLHKAITPVLPELERKHGSLRYRLKRAKSTGSKMAAASKFRKDSK
jgi:hypothetical protein